MKHLKRIIIAILLTITIPTAWLGFHLFYYIREINDERQIDIFYNSHNPQTLTLQDRIHLCELEDKEQYDGNRWNRLP